MFRGRGNSVPLEMKGAQRDNPSAQRPGAGHSEPRRRKAVGPEAKVFFAEREQCAIVKARS